MNAIVLEPKFGMSPAEMAAVLEKSGLQEGGEVFIKRLKALDDNAWNSLLIITLVAVAVIAGVKRMRDASEKVQKVEADIWSHELLRKLFEGVDAATLEQEIEERTAVTITIDDTEEWPTAGMYLLNRAYGDDEIDISGITALEPNPDHEP